MAMDKDMAQQQFTVMLVGKNILSPEEQEATRDKIIASAPQGIVEDMRKEGACDWEIALAQSEAYFIAIDGGKDETPDPTKTNSKSKTEPVTVKMTAEEERSLRILMDEDAVKKGEKADKSYVISVLTDAPILSEIIVPGATLTPAITENTDAKFNEWESKLVDDAENKKQFAQLKASFTKKEQLPVYVNTKAKAKVIGYKIGTIDDNGTPTTKILDKEAMMVFLIYEVSGILAPRSDNAIGVKLRWRAAKTTPDVTEGTNKSGSAIVALINGKVMKDNPKLSECTSAATEDIVYVRARTAQSFTILTGKGFHADGTPKTRVVRLSGTTKAKAVKRIEQYVNAFGAYGQKNSGKLTKKAKNELQNAILYSMLQMSRGELTMVGDYGREVQSKIASKVRASGNAQPTGHFE